MTVLNFKKDFFLTLHSVVIYTTIINEDTVPKMIRLSAQTSTVAFIWEFMRQ